MIDSLAESVFAAGDHMSSAAELGALVDIATFKCEDAHFASHHAEQKLLDIYADPNISSAIRHDLIVQLSKTTSILAEERCQNGHAFAMPGSLLHLTAQYARAQIATEDATAVIDPSYLEEIKSTLIDATCLQDENKEGRDISDSGRLVTSDEVIATFATISCGYLEALDLSHEVMPAMKEEQIKYLLEDAGKKELVTAPLILGSHFMLAVVEKTTGSDTFRINIVNTNMAPDTVFTENFNDKLIEDFKKNTPAGEKASIEVHHAAMQEHAINSCGALVSLLAKTIDNAREEKGFHVRKAIRENLIEFTALSARQQKDLVMAQRSRMIGSTVFYKNERRFVFPDRIPPRETVAQESETTHL